MVKVFIMSLKMTFTATILIFTLSLVSYCGSVPVEGSCDMNLLESCPVSWIEAYFEADIILPTAEFLDNHCGTILSYMECMKSLIHNCRSTMKNMAVKARLWDAFDNLFSELCNQESNMRRGYLPYVPCINDKNSGFRELIGNAHVDMMNAIKVRSNDYQTPLNKDATVEIICILYRTHAPIFAQTFAEKCVNLTPPFESTMISGVSPIDIVSLYCPESRNDTALATVTPSPAMSENGTESKEKEGSNANVQPAMSSCDVSLFQACPTSWITSYSDANIVLPTGDFLDRHCGSMTSYLQCVKSFTLGCYRAKGMPIGDQSWKIVGNILSELCNRGSMIRKEYLRYVPCINDERNGFGKLITDAAIDVSQAMQQRSLYFKNILGTDERREIVCEFLKTHGSKLGKNFVDKCGNLTTNFGRGTRYGVSYTDIIGLFCHGVKSSTKTIPTTDVPTIDPLTEVYGTPEYSNVSLPSTRDEESVTPIYDNFTIATAGQVTEQERTEEKLNHGCMIAPATRISVWMTALLIFVVTKFRT